MTDLRTERLILRHWQPSDRAPFARLNADPRVMEFFPDCLTTDESGALVDRIENHWLQHGLGPYAVEVAADHAFIGFVGLIVPDFEAAFTPCVEVGWRLASEYWGQGLATEGAREVVRHAAEELGSDALVSMTVPANVRSRRVMEKLGRPAIRRTISIIPKCRRDTRCVATSSIGFLCYAEQLLL